MRVLYILTTKDLGEFYIIAETATEAQELLEESLSKADYGFTKGREVTNIKIVTNEVVEGYDKKPNFSYNGTLLIKKDS